MKDFTILDPLGTQKSPTWEANTWLVLCISFSTSLIIISIIIIIIIISNTIVIIIVIIITVIIIVVVIVFAKFGSRL